MFNFQKIITGNTLLDRIQSNISQLANSIVGPFLGGNLITGKKIATTPTTIAHGLGRVPQIWVICDQDTQTTVNRISWDTNNIVLEAASACTISFWVN